MFRFFALLLLSMGISSSYQMPIKSVVAIDVGHSPKRGGALSLECKNEYYYNKAAAKRLQKSLAELGIKSFIIDAGEQEFSLADRARIAKKKGASAFVSIHSVKRQFLTKTSKGCPIDKDRKFHGYSIFISKKNPRLNMSKNMALFVGDALRYYGFKPTLYHTLNIKGERKKALDKHRGIFFLRQLGSS